MRSTHFAFIMTMKLIKYNSFCMLGLLSLLYFSSFNEHIPFYKQNYIKILHIYFAVQTIISQHQATQVYSRSVH